MIPCVVPRAALVAGVPVLAVPPLLAGPVAVVAAILVLRRLLSCRRCCTRLWFTSACLAASCSRFPVPGVSARTSSRSPRPALRFPVLGIGALAGPGARLAASCSRCPVPGVSARSCVAFSTSRPRDSLSLALASSPVPSSSSVSRPTSSLFLSTSASSYSSPTILASLSFPSVVWNSPVVQKTDVYRLQQRRCE